MIPYRNISDFIHPLRYLSDNGQDLLLAVNQMASAYNYESQLAHIVIKSYEKRWQQSLKQCIFKHIVIVGLRLDVPSLQTNWLLLCKLYVQNSLMNQLNGERTCHIEFSNACEWGGVREYGSPLVTVIITSLRCININYCKYLYIYFPLTKGQVAGDYGKVLPRLFLYFRLHFHLQ